MLRAPFPARGATWVVANLALWSAAFGCDAPKQAAMDKTQDAAPADSPGDRCENPRPYYHDADGDGYGNLLDELVTCVKPADYVNRPIDCDDRNGLVHPLAEELCDGVDNDCNRVIDDGEGLECVSDTYFSCQTSCETEGTRYCSKQCQASECMPPAELCNYKDDNCDGIVDEQLAALSDESVSLSTRLDHLLPDGARQWIAVSGDGVQPLDFFGRALNNVVKLGLGARVAAAQVIGETVVLAWLVESKVDETCTGTSLLAQAFRKNTWAPIMGPQTIKTDAACRPMTAQMVSLGEELLFVVATRDATSETTELSTVVSSQSGVARTTTPLTTLQGADVSDAFRLVATPAAATQAALVYLDPDVSSEASIRLATLTHDGALAAPAITLDTGDVLRPALAYNGQSTLLVGYDVARDLVVRKVALTSSGGIGDRHALLSGSNASVPSLAFHGGRWFVGALAESCDPTLPTCAGGRSLHVHVLGNDDLEDLDIVTPPIPVLRGVRHHLSVNTLSALFVVGNESVNHAYLWACKSSGSGGP